MLLYGKKIAAYTSNVAATVARMAKSTITSITDDVDGTEGAQTINFGFRGKNYTIDLGPKNLDKLTRVLEPWISKAAPVRDAVRTRPGKAADLDPKAIRAWAAENNLAVNQKGRVRPDIVEMYRTAHS